MTRDSGFAGSSFLVHRQPPPEQKPRSTLLDNSSCERTDNAMDSTRATPKPSTLFTPPRQSWTTRNQVNVSEAERRLRRNVAATLPIGTSRCDGSLEVVTCGSASASSPMMACPPTQSRLWNLLTRRWSMRRSTSPTPSVRLCGGKHLRSRCRADTSIRPDPRPGGRRCSVLTRRHSTARGFQVVLADQEGASVPAARTEMRQMPVRCSPGTGRRRYPGPLVDQAITVVVT